MKKHFRLFLQRTNMEMHPRTNYCIHPALSLRGFVPRGVWRKDDWEEYTEEVGRDITDAAERVASTPESKRGELLLRKNGVQITVLKDADGVMRGLVVQADTKAALNSWDADIAWLVYLGLRSLDG